MATSARPGFVRRLAAGAYHIPHGIVAFVRSPRLWPMGLLAALVAGFATHLGAVGGAFLVPIVEPYLAPAAGSVSPWLDIAFTLTVWLGGLGSGALLGFACGLAPVAPLLEALSRRRDVGLGTERAPGRGRLALESMKGSLLLLAIALLAVPASFAPLTGPLLGLVLAAALLGARGMASALVRRGLGLRARLAWFRSRLVETSGLGLAGLVVLLVPGVNFLLAPALFIGGTDLVREIGEWETTRAEESVAEGLEPENTSQAEPSVTEPGEDPPHEPPAGTGSESASGRPGEPERPDNR